MKNDSNVTTAVNAARNQFQRFSNEILAIIFFYYHTAMTGLTIDPVRFDIFQRMNKFKHLRATSHSVLHLVTTDFYRNNTFIFRPMSAMHLSLPRQLPPLKYRQHLRRVQIHLELRDWRLVQGGLAQRLMTSADWLSHCAGARQLQQLTNAGTGFDSLMELELHITVDFLFDQHIQQTLEIVAGAGLVVKAKKLTVILSPLRGPTHAWFAELAQLLGPS